MATWINHVTVAAPRNGTTSHTVGPDGTGGTVVGGTAFTPTAGRYLLAVVEGGVTSSTPTGYALGTSAVNNTGLYAFHRNSAAGTTADHLTTTHNAPNYPIVFDFYEFPAGTTWTNGVGGTNLGASSGNTPTLGSLTGTYWAGYVHAFYLLSGTAAGVETWTAPAVKQSDANAPSSTSDDGYEFSMADQANATGASTSGTYTNTVSTGVTSEALTFAQVVAAGGATVTGSSALSVQSTLTASATAQTPAADVPGAAALTATGGLTAAGKAATKATAALAGNTGLTAAGKADVRAGAALTATGATTATASTSTPNAPQVFGTAALVASSTLAAAGKPDVRGTAALAAQTTWAATGKADDRAAAVLAAAAQITATAHAETSGTATLTAAAILTAQGGGGTPVNITVQAGQPTRAWNTQQPTKTWAAGQPTT